MSAATRSAAPRVKTSAPSVGRTSTRAVRPPLAVVATPGARHGRSMFVAVVAGLLVLGLASLLALNTLLAQDAFVLSTLEQRSAALAVSEESLAAQVAAQEDPNRLAARARAMGMTPSGPPTFITLPDGKKVGAKPKTKDRGSSGGTP